MSKPQPPFNMADFMNPSGGSRVNKEEATTESTTAPVPGKKGLILGPDGKPCRTCNSLADLLAAAAATGKTPATTTTGTTSITTTTALPSDCPPDVETLGRHTWTLLHSITATYPTVATTEKQQEMATFLDIFGRIYPCWFCARDFRKWKEENKPKLETREEFGDWMCRAHNAVNKKLGKKEFDCRFWEERWREAKDGRCG